MSVYGLGLLETGSFAETMQVKCLDVIADTILCTRHICMPHGVCTGDSSGPVVNEFEGELYYAGIIYVVDGDQNCSEFIQTYRKPSQSYFY